MAEHFDPIVLGGDPGGHVVAIRASQLGLGTAVVKKQYWGSVCLDIGCIPSESLLKNAEVAHILNHEVKTFGISDDVSFDFGTAHACPRKVSMGIVKGVYFLMKKSKVIEINGFGGFTGPTSMAIIDGGDKGKEIIFDKAIIVTGSVICSLPGARVGDDIVSYEEQTLSNELPDSMIIVGAGAIGMEFVYVSANYGVDVTIVEFMDNVLPNEDADVSKAIAKGYKKPGTKLTTGHETTPIVDNGDLIEVKVEAKDGGDEQTLTVDHVMVSIEFAPRIEGIGLSKTGAELGKRGEIVVDECMCINVGSIYTIGDVTMKLQPAHVVEAQSVIATEHMAGHKAETIPDYFVVSCATSYNPQVASFDKTGAQAKKWTEENGREIKVSTSPFPANGKAQGLAEPAGFVKLTADAEYGELLGGHMVGANVPELMPQLVLAEKYELVAEEIGRAIHIYSTMSEAMKGAAESVVGKMVNL